MIPTGPSTWCPAAADATAALAASVTSALHLIFAVLAVLGAIATLTVIKDQGLDESNQPTGAGGAAETVCGRTNYQEESRSMVTETRLFDLIVLDENSLFREGLCRTMLRSAAWWTT
ncbi:MAG: hypothetical protein ACRDTA_20540 [Pseudonocardiaceae bacterium]